MKRLIAALALCAALAPALAEGLAPPSAPAVPNAEQDAQFFLVSAELLAQIQAVIEAQRREIERLRRANKTECN